jgi:hypothetical protein
VDSTTATILGLSLTLVGFGMELIRPFLYRKQIKVPEQVDIALAIGGVLLMGGGVYLLWGVLSPHLVIQWPVALVHLPETHIATTWPDLFAFFIIVHAVMWAAVRLPPRLVSQTNPSYFDLGFMVGRLKYKEAAEVGKLDTLKVRCEHLGLSYTAIKLARVLDAIDTDRFWAEEKGLDEHGDFTKSEMVFDHEMADIEKSIAREFEQQRKRKD